MLVLVRHGESTLNAEGRLVGHLDPALTEHGEDQARAAGRMLGSVSELRHSPLTRTTQTARLLGLDVPPVVEGRAIELDYGALDGERLVDVDPKVWQRWLTEPTFTPEGGESLADLGRRVEGLVEELFATKGEGARSRDGDVVVVSHVGPRCRRAGGMAAPSLDGIGDPDRYGPARTTGGLVQRDAVWPLRSPPVTLVRWTMW